MLGERQQAILRAVAKKAGDPLMGEPNPLLDAAIDQVMLEQPHAFLEEHEFKNRNFYHKPKNKDTVFKSYIKE